MHPPAINPVDYMCLTNILNPVAEVHSKNGAIGLIHRCIHPQNEKFLVKQQRPHLGPESGQVLRKSQPPQRGDDDDDDYDDMITVYLDAVNTDEDVSPLQPLSGQTLIVGTSNQGSSQGHRKRRLVLLGNINNQVKGDMLLLELQIKRSTIAPWVRKIPLDTPIEIRRKFVRKIFMAKAIKAKLHRFPNQCA